MKNLYDYERTQSATTDLPFGALKNESSPGKQDGTDIVAEHIQDLAYSLYQVLQLAGINPNGELEDGNNKTQFIESLTNIGVFRYSDKTSYNYGVFTWQVIGNTFTLYRSLKNSNSDDVNNNESWLKILEIGADNKINFNVDTNILGLSANPSLSNLSEAGEDRLNVSKMYETGAVSNDTKGFKELLKRAHSTFDKSKFEVVGSPTITDNGIASGFSIGNSINLGKYNIQNELHIKCNSNNVNLTGTNRGAICSWYQNEQNYFRLFWYSNTQLRFDYFKQDESSVTANSFNYDANGNYIFDIIYKNNKLSLLKDGEVIHTYNGAINLTALNLVDGQLGVQTVGSWYLENGSIDLKFIAIWADGLPVFNGNKTGLYVAKTDNYTVEGSPTITDDGVASGFSASNYITKAININATKSIEVIFGYYFNNLTGGAFNFIGGELNGVRAFYGKYVNIWSNTGQLLEPYDYTSALSLLNGDFVTTSLLLTSNKIVAKIMSKGKTITREVDVNLTLSATSILIGKETSGDNYFKSILDHNAFKIYVDGNLIYQPCLKIPYNETFEHPNVVDVAYRNRVQDLYEQTGEALFYTIDEQNQNFTLPSGDIYGMITKNREILDIVYPIGRPMPEENNVLLDNEVWLEGATVNIVDYPKLFKVYGTKYGGDGTTTFKLPDLRNRVLWGSSDGSNGYIESKLPNIKGDFILGGDGGTHPQTGSSAASGAYQFTSTSSGATFENTGAGQTRYDNINFNASRSNSIYSDSTKIVQPPAFKVRWKTRFE